METESYWRATASLPKFEQISTDLKVDVVVIGAGLTGTTTAYLLKKEGAKVALLERGRCAGSDTSRTTAHPLFSREGRSAAPIGPETPLTRILEFMTCRLPLYQFAVRPNKLRRDLKSLKGMKEQF